MRENDLYKIFKIENYGNAPKCNWESWSTSGNIITICDLLKTDNNYNEHLSNDSLVKVFFDIEVKGLAIDAIINVIIIIFKEKLNLDVVKKDIKYTSNDKKFNEVGSYHITIPKYYAVNETLKLFKPEFKRYDIDIDSSVYGNKFFRLPNQTGKKVCGEIKYNHIIQNGNLVNFVLLAVDKSHSKNISKLLLALAPKPKPTPTLKSNSKSTEVSVIDKSTLELLLEGLTLDFLEDYSSWFSLGALLYNLDENNLDLFDRISSKATSKYTVDGCEKLWTGLRKNNYTIGSLHYWVKNDNPEYYANLSFIQTDEEENIIVDTIQIQKEYLTKLNNGVLEIDDDVVKYCDQLFQTDCKSLNIKSPYGTSKTQLVKLIIKQYNPKRILWLSFRQTLSDDIHHHFKELGFQHYLDGRLDSDRLIIQVESLMKIRQFELMDWIDDLQETHHYDLIMLDEVESLLRQFSSQDTFSKDANTRDTFEYLEEILKKSSKIISLDGDLHNRSYQFIKQFGEGIYLENLTTKNNKEITITEDATEFKKDILKSLKKKNKIVICSLSTDKSRFYKELIEQKYPELRVIFYTGSSDCKTKKIDFKDVNVSWSQYDVVIYTPTIEAGVSFEVCNHFDKIYGLINTNSCCQQSFFQMLSRVRNPRSNQILILNNGIYNPEREQKKIMTFKFEEVKQSYIEARKNLRILYKDGKSTLGLDNYTINSIYNDVEALNKNNKVWLTYFRRLGERKGYSITFSENEQKKIKSDDFKGNAELLFEAEDIDDSTYDALLKRQRGKDTSESENYEIARKTLEKRIGLKLNPELIEKFYQKEQSIKNFTYLIDRTNFKETNDSFSDSKKVKLELIDQVFERANIDFLSEEDCYFPNAFINCVKDLPIFDDASQLLFGCYPNSSLRNDPKKILKYLNDILENYNLAFTTIYNGKRVQENKRIMMSRLNCITEIVYYQKLRGVIHDTNNRITKPEILKYKNLFSHFELEL